MPLSLRALFENKRVAITLILGAGLLTAAGLAINHTGIGWVKPLVTVDGTYQTFAMLSRLSQGSLPGLGNVPYLGVLLCYALAPAFFLFGGTIFAAFAAAQLLVQLAWFGTCVVLLWALGFSRRSALSAGALIYSALFVLSLATGFASVAYRAGQSMIFLRDSAGLVIALAIISIREDRPRRLAMAIGLGVMLFWSPSSGISLMIAGLAVLGIGLIRHHGLWRGLVLAVAHAAIAACSAALTASLLSGGSPLWLFQKVFLNAGQTQFWFFGGFGENDRLLNLADTVRMFAPNWTQGAILALLLAATLFAYVRAGIGSRRSDTIGLICGAQLISGLASQAAGHISAYYLASFSASAELLVIGLAFPLVLQWSPPPRKLIAGLALVAIAGVCAIPLLALTSQGQKLQNAAHAQRFLANRMAFAEAGMDFPASTQAEIAFLRNQRAAMDRAAIPADRRMISAYYSWADVTLGAVQQPHFNSIIQLMSDADRAEFTRHLRDHNPELVATFDPAATPWALWNLRASWDFYRAALAGHDPAWRGSSMLYWRRRLQPLAPATTGLPACHLSRLSAKSVVLQFAGGNTGPEPVLLDVALTYSANPGKPGWNGDLGRGYLRVTDRSQLLVANMARMEAGGLFISNSLNAAPGFYYGLPAGNRQWAIPVEYQTGAVSPLQLDLQGGATGQLDITSCRVTGVWPNPFAQLDRLPRLAPPAKM